MSSREEIERQVGAVASMVKLATGVANNAAIAIMLDAHDQAKRHPNYRHKCKQAYRQALKEWHDYEAHLLHADSNRFFHVSDMDEATRKKYGDITDRQYFEFWQGMGAYAYQETRPLVTSLWNKYRLSLVNHKAAHPDLLAWPMVGMAVLNLACSIHEHSVEEACRCLPIDNHIVKHIFAQLSLRRVLAEWVKALDLTDPTVHYDLEPTEQRNIELGVMQLAEAWANPDLLYDSSANAIPDFEEIFRTKGEMKKSMREIADMKSRTQEELEK